MANIDNMQTVNLYDENGDEIEVSFTDIISVKGNCSIGKGQRIAEEHFDSRNVCVSYVYTEEKEKLSLSSDTFIANSKICDPNSSYGHDCVTAEFKVTHITCMTINKGKPEFTELIYAGATTDNKLLNFVRESLNNRMACIKSKKVTTERRWMSKSKYERLARAEMKTNTNTDTEE
jgi:hypothetical protein